MWTYILQRDKSILEVKLTKEQYEALIQSWQKGGILVIQDQNNEPIGINAVDISRIMTEKQYLTWIDSSNPMKYILKGNWYDRKSKDKPVRQEKWREENDKKLIEEKTKREEPITEEEKQIAQRNLDRIRKELEEKGILTNKNVV